MLRKRLFTKRKHQNSPSPAWVVHLSCTVPYRYKVWILSESEHPDQNSTPHLRVGSMVFAMWDVCANGATYSWRQCDVSTSIIGSSLCNQTQLSTLGRQTDLLLPCKSWINIYIAILFLPMSKFDVFVCMPNSCLFLSFIVQKTLNLTCFFLIEIAPKLRKYHAVSKI